MREVTAVAAGAGFTIERVTVRAESEAWSEPEVPGTHRLMFVRRGVFRARVGGARLPADPASAYFGGPGDEHSIAHRPFSEDVRTSVRLSSSLMAELSVRAPARPCAREGRAPYENRGGSPTRRVSCSPPTRPRWACATSPYGSGARRTTSAGSSTGTRA